jgi:hypothetical protein
MRKVAVCLFASVISTVALAGQATPMSFEFLAIATSIATLILATGWLFFGRLFLKRWGIDAAGTDLILGRRIGAIYFGLSVIFFLAHNAPPSELRDHLSLGALIVVSLLGALGAYEFKVGRVGPAMLISVAVEIFLGIGFALLLWG